MSPSLKDLQFKINHKTINRKYAFKNEQIKTRSNTKVKWDKDKPRQKNNGRRGKQKWPELKQKQTCEKRRRSKFTIKKLHKKKRWNTQTPNWKKEHRKEVRITNTRFKTGIATMKKEFISYKGQDLQSESWRKLVMSTWKRERKEEKSGDRHKGRQISRK